MEEQTSASSNLVETGGVALLTYTLCSDKKLLKTLTGEDQTPRTRFSFKIVYFFYVLKSMHDLIAVNRGIKTESSKYY